MPGCGFKQNDMKKILNNIIHRIKEDSLAKRQEAVVRRTEYKELKSIKTGLVIWSANSGQAECLNKLSVGLKGVKFDRLCYMSPKESDSEPANALVLRNEDLGFGGKIQNTRLPEVLNCPYDLLVDLSTESNVQLNYVLLNSQALCKIGMNREGGTHDVVIDGVSAPLQFIDKLIEILSDIKEYKK